MFDVDKSQIASSIAESKLPNLILSNIGNSARQKHPLKVKIQGDASNSLRRSIQRIKQVNNNGGLQAQLNRLLQNSSAESSVMQSPTRRPVADEITRLESRRLLGKSESRLEKSSNLNLFLLVDSSQS